MSSGDYSTRVTGSTVGGSVIGGMGNVVQSPSGGGEPPERAHIQQALAELRARLASGGAAPEQVGPALRDLDDIHAEVAQADPDRRRIHDAFERIVERLGRASELLGGVYYAKQLIEAFLP